MPRHGGTDSDRKRSDVTKDLSRPTVAVRGGHTEILGKLAGVIRRA